MPYTRRDVLKAIPALLVGCGGKSDGPVQTGTLYPQSPKGKIFCYYGSKSGEAEDQFKNTQDHVSHHWIMPWSGLRPAQFPNGLPLIYGPTSLSESGLISEFTSLRDASVLPNIDIIYFLDEPNISAPFDYQMGRSVMDRFSELSKAKVAIIYAASNTNRPGLRFADLASVDNYGIGAAVLDSEIAVLRSQLSTSQKLLLTVGVASPWMQDPEPFYQRMLADDKVSGIVAFTYFSNVDPLQGFTLGAKDNGMLARCREIGLRIK